MGKLWQPPPEQAALVGSMSDVKVATLLKVSPNTILAYRKRIALESHRSQRGVKKVAESLSEEHQALLGKISDPDLAKLTGVHVSRIGKFRMSLGILASRSELTWRPTPGQVAMLGNESDASLARRWRVERGAIVKYRRDHGIATWQKPAWEPTLEQAALIGTLSDAEVAKIAGVPGRAVYEYRRRHGIKSGFAWQPTPEQLALLGKIPDGILAKQAGVHMSTVLKYRKELGIGAYVHQAAGVPLEKPYKLYEPSSSAILALLGYLSDAEIARREKVQNKTIGLFRQKLGISPWKAGVNPPAHGWRELAELFGRESDEEIARQAGLDASIIAAFRMRRGIPALGEKTLALKSVNSEPDQDFQHLLKAMSSFCQRERRLPEFHELEEGLPIGRWRRRLDALRLRGQLLEGLRQEMEQIEGWNWTEDDWYSDYEEVEQALQDGHSLPSNLESWLQRQLHDFEHFALSPEKLPLLSALPVECRRQSGRTMNKSEWMRHCSWYENFEALKRYMACHKHIPTQKRNGKTDFGRDLNSWLLTQRAKHRDGKLDPAQKAKLDELCGDWATPTHDKVFQAKVEWLIEWHRKHGIYPDGDAWVVDARIHYRQGSLNPKRIPVLEALPGWSWDPQEDRWEEMYAKMLDFVSIHERIPGVRDHWQGVKIGAWAQAQRQNVGRQGYSPHHLERLEQIPGWVWNMKTSQWERNYEKLKAFIEEHDRLPIKNEFYRGFCVGNFMHLQKLRPRGSREARLLETLPHWRWDFFEEIWVERLEQFKLAMSSGATPDLLWAQNQRNNFAKGRLDPEKIKALEAIPGWSWHPHEASWNSKFQALKAHLVTADLLLDFTSPLGTWCAAQRLRYHKGELRQDRLALLETLPKWTWSDIKRQ